MTRHSKVFVPVSAVDAAKLDAGKLLKVYKEHKQGGYSLYGFAEEKENVYVLTEQEFQEEKKKEAIALLRFAEWASHSDWTYLPSKKLWYNEEDEENITPKTTEQLYELFN